MEKMNINSEKSLYFKSKKNAIKCYILREHEYYLWKFQSLLRKEENSKSALAKMWFRRRKNILGRSLGLTIPGGVFGEGLHIWHYGMIIVNAAAKVGKHCQLHGNNVIGNNGSSLDAPIIGDNVDIGAGAMIIGGVRIADNIKIGAGAVVVSSCLEEGCTLVGIPARKVEK